MKKERNKPPESFSWNMNETGTIEVFLREYKQGKIEEQYLSIADIWRIKDYPGGEVEARKAQILLADGITQLPHLVNFMKTIYDMFNHPDDLNDMGQDGQERIMGYLEALKHRCRRTLELLED